VAVSGAEDNGRIYVADYNNRRLVRLTRNARYDGCFVAADTSSTQLVQPQALDFAADGRLVVVDRNIVKIFDVGVRSAPPPQPPPAEVHDVSGTAETPPVAPTDDGAVATASDAKHAAAATKHKVSRTGPKPAVPPRPKFLKELTFADGSNPAQRGRTKTSTAAATTSDAGTAATTTTTPSSTVPQLKAARQASNTPVTPHTPTNSLLETEVW